MGLKINQIKEEIKNKLKELADSKYKEFHSGLCPNTENILGVRVPVLRNYAKEISKQYEIEVLLKNIDNEYYEEVLLQGMLIGLSKEKDIEKILGYIKEFIPKIDNWAICDGFCAGLKITKKNKEIMREFIKPYLNSSKEFEIRFGIVMILDYYIEEKYLEENFKIFEHVKNEEYYVQMAIAWAISICLIKYFDKTIDYLKISKLDKFTYNKSLQKGIESFRISEENKKILRNMKKI